MDFLLLCDLIVPAVVLAAGCCMRFRPPKHPNGLVGYRTARSEQNQDTWDFAQMYCGKLWQKLGALLLALGVLAALASARAGEKTATILTLALLALQILAVLGSIAPVECALRRTFDENGTRR